MLQLVALVVLLSSWTLAVDASEQQSPLLLNSGSTHTGTAYQEHIAIIGAGIGGASAAFNIHEYNRNLPSQRVTIIEGEFNVGGRVKSVYLYPNEGGLKVIEDGATHFYTDDWCLISAMQNVGLELTKLPPWVTYQPRNEGIRTDLKCNVASTAWKDFLYGTWKYGRSWRVLHAAVRSHLEKWKSFGEGLFSSTAKEFHDVGLTDTDYGCATVYLQNLTVNDAMQTQFVQPCIRARLSQDLSEISGLYASMAAGKVARESVDGGNSRLIERLIRLSEADLQIGTVVTSIAPGLSRRYRLSISKLLANGSSEASDAEFDMVIIAAPLTSYEIDVNRLNMRHTVSPASYLQTHVTHFASPILVSSNLSVLPLDINIVDDISLTETLTTSTTAEGPNILNLQRSDACFRRGCIPGSECDECDEDENLYRVHSRKYIEDADIVRMIGQEPNDNKELSDYGIHFVRRRAWPYSYPQSVEGKPGLVDEIELAPGLYYLNGAESVISSMEMSCRMGRNVAHKVTRYGQGLKL